MAVRNAKFREYATNSWQVHSKWVNCELCEFYLNKTAKKYKEKKASVLRSDLAAHTSSSLLLGLGSLSGMVTAPVRSCADLACW